jgi:hypothetical protein
MSFFKNDNGQVLEGPNFVIAPTFELRAATKNDYNYPIEGWYWFDTDVEAYAFFGLEMPVPDNDPSSP